MVASLVKEECLKGTQEINSNPLLATITYICAFDLNQGTYFCSLPSSIYVILRAKETARWYE